MPTHRQLVQDVRLKAQAACAADKTRRAAYAAGLRQHSPERYHDVLQAFWCAVTVALPSTTPGYTALLSAGDPDAIDRAVAFLEADPYFFSSGWEKQALIRHLKRIPLSAVQRERLHAIILERVDQHAREEFRHYGRLARGIRTPELMAALEVRQQSPDPGIARRASWILYAITNG